MNRNTLLWAFALSGMTAMIYEIVWSRPLQLIFGSTIYAVSTILTTFFVGFALGSYAARNLAETERKAVELFSFFQIAIGLYGLLILPLFTLTTQIYLSVSDIPIVKFVLLFMILITPATLFGATWPVLNSAYVQKVGKDAARLYAANSFGSFAGPIAAGFLLIPLLGIKTTSILVAVTNILLGIAIWTYTKGVKHDKK